MLRLSRLTILPVLAAACAQCLAAGDTAELEAQRQAFREAYPQAELGIWRLSADREALLRRYVLWPDLRAAWLKARVRTDAAEVREFLASYADMKPARELRYRYALALAGQHKWPEFLDLYRAHYRQLGIAKLDCLALRAELDTLSAQERRARAMPLWLTPASQAKECDPVFARLRREGALDEELHRQRYALAIEARELGIARYLARSLPDSYQTDARRWTRAIGLPQQFLDEHDPTLQTPQYREQLASAVQKIAYNEPQLAQQHWLRIEGRHEFTPAQRDEIERHIALWLARNHRADAYRALVTLSGAAVDDEVRRWRVRTALRARRWADVIRHVNDLPAEARGSDQWRYWLAIALQGTGDLAARQILESLAGERSYYGFLAADALLRDYAYQHRELEANDAVLQELALRPTLRRARELFMVGLDGRGRSEWDSAVAAMTVEQQVQAAILAHRWGWHSRAIATAALNDRFDDLFIRYPLPYAAEFASATQDAGIRASWAYGIARSESLFMADIRSSAGAIGVMQLMPATGRLAAKQLKVSYEGRSTLTDPASNIRLGSWFLGNLQQRFARHPVLATAAYNAGPLRVEAWLPEQDSLDARIWIENIPYAETRRYVRRVLTADAIFHWRMLKTTSRLSARLQPVLPLTRVAAMVAGQESPSSAND